VASPRAVHLQPQVSQVSSCAAELSLGKVKRACRVAGMANRRLKRMDLSRDCVEALEKANLEFAKVRCLNPATPCVFAPAPRLVCFRFSLAHKTLSWQDVMNKNKQELVGLLGLHGPVCEDLLNAVAANICPNPRSVLDAIQAKQSDERFMPTAMPALDVTLRGGLPCGGITEVVGPAGVGKTQFCLQHCVHAITEWVQFSAIYIDTVAPSQSAPWLHLTPEPVFTSCC
jgi:hypothetical protein